MTEPITSFSTSNGSDKALATSSSRVAATNCGQRDSPAPRAPETMVRACTAASTHGPCPIRYWMRSTARANPLEDW